MSNISTPLLAIYATALTLISTKSLPARNERGGGGPTIEVLLLIGGGIVAAVAVGAFVTSYISSHMPG